jgi:hypothetical protein
MAYALTDSTFKDETKRKRYELLRSQLDLERSSFMGHWRDLGDYILPRRPRMAITDRNRGDRRNQKIIDSTATLAARTLRSGMMGGITSPARPWKRLTTPDPELAEYGAVKEWLEIVDQRMSTVFLRSNLYNILPITYGDLGVFGTAAVYMEEDFDNVIHAYSKPIGSYWIANDHKLKVRVFMEEYSMTVRQVIQAFGKRTRSGEFDGSNLSQFVRDQYAKGNYETWVDIAHVVQPNEEYDETKLESRFKKYTSCYYERGSSQLSNQNYVSGDDENRYLSEKGYDYFPILAPRWEITGEDVYGTDCPGMAALGDVKQLQTGEKRSAQAIEKMVNPPMTGPTVLRNQPSSILPGGTTWVDVREGQGGFRPAHEVRFSINELEMKQQQVRERISKAFYEDLFLMLAQSDRREITAREVEERHEEKLLALGPVLESLNQDLLDPLIDNTFMIMMKQGLIPPPPEEIQGTDLKVEYISVMAQAQKLVGISGIERFSGFVGNLVNQTQDTSILDKVDMDQLVDEYSNAVGISPKIVRTDDEVAEIRQQKAETAQTAQTREALPELAKGAKDLAAADMSGDNALTRLVSGKGE